MMTDPAPKHLSFRWDVLVEKTEQRPLCQVMWGRDRCDSLSLVLCYRFSHQHTLYQARDFLQKLSCYPWFEGFKALHESEKEWGSGVLSVVYPEGPVFQEALARANPLEQLRLCLELARAIATLHQLNAPHGNLNGSNVMYHEGKRLPIIIQTVCGFFPDQVFSSALPPERRLLKSYIAEPSDDVWQFGALFLKRISLRTPQLSALIFKSTQPQAQDRPTMADLVTGLEALYQRHARKNKLSSQPSHKLIKLMGVALLMSAAIAMVSPKKPGASIQARELVSDRVYTLIKAPYEGDRALTLGETAADLSVLLGREVVVSPVLSQRMVKPSSWNVWDQMLTDMALGWRLNPDGSLEIYEKPLKTVSNERSSQ